MGASRARINIGQPVMLSGLAAGVPAGTHVRLYKSPYPYPPATLLYVTIEAKRLPRGFDGRFIAGAREVGGSLAPQGYRWRTCGCTMD